MNLRRSLTLLAVLILNLYLLALMFIAVVGDIKDEGGNSSLERDHHDEVQRLGIPKVDKIVLIIIDAMRFDFVPHMKFVSSLLDVRERACIFKVDLEGPTVTLPRIKALVTGSSSTYWDFLANLKGSSGLSTDNFLTHSRAAGKEIVFYGDDTWLKLFPSTVFKRSEGVTSFFVTDFYEVDENVTRNVRAELESVKFDLMILHYLGVDHVGHVHGPKHPLIATKLEEMDSVVEHVYRGLLATPSDKPHLILITGDHGMASVGGHGGDSLPEITTPLVVISVTPQSSAGPSNPICRPPPSAEWLQEAYQLHQYDIVTTLAFLWDLPFPSKSRGVIAEEIISTLPISAQLNGLEKNADHLLEFLPEDSIATEDLKSRYKNLLEQHKLIRGSLTSSDYSSESLLSEYKGLIKRIQPLVVYKTEQDVMTMVMCSIVLLELVLIILLWESHSTLTVHYRHFLFPTFVVCAGFYILQSLLSVILILCSSFLPVLLSSQQSLRKCRSLCDGAPNFATKLLWFGSPLVYFSSSFVEEEHYILYFVYSTSIVICTAVDSKGLSTSAILLLLHRLCSSLNSTGMKWNYLPDANYYLKLYGASTLLVLIAVLIMLTQFRTHFERLCLFLVALYKLECSKQFWSGNYSHVEAKLCYFAILLSGVVGKLRGIKFIDTSGVLICTLLLRTKNIPLVPLVYLQAQLLKFKDYTLPACLLFLCAFFYQGNSNNVTTIDISLGYTGLSEYNEYLVGLLTFISTFALPIMVIITVLTVDGEEDEGCDGSFLEALVLRTCLTNFIYSLVLLLMRQHLFIWSVFVPKLLYLIAFTFLIMSLVLLLFASTAAVSLSQFRAVSVEGKEKKKRKGF